MKNYGLIPSFLIKIMVVSFLVLGFLFPSASNAQTIQTTIRYVKPGGTGDCSTWGNACKLVVAINASISGDEIWVASGTYTPGGLRTNSFVLKSGVEIYGGFPATGGDWASRDWQANLTILSADIGTAGVPEDNNFHVVTGDNIDSAAVLDGFTIRDGYADGPDDPDWYGAGILLTGSSPVLRNLLITSNVVPGGSGGGLYLYQSSPTISDVTFTNNTSNTGGGLYNEEGSPALTNVIFTDNTALFWGGGMHSEYAGTPTLTDVSFTGNAVTGTEATPMCFGGGMSIAQGSAPTLTDVSFTSNTSDYDAGGLFNGNNGSVNLTNVTFELNTASDYGGGMLTNTTGHANLTNVTFTSNTASGYGGGLYNAGTGSTVLNNVTFTSNTSNDSGGGMHNYDNDATLSNVIFSDNESVLGEGGGLFNYSSSPALTDVTFANNTAGTIGGGMQNYSGNPTLTNITFSGNSAQSGGGMANYVSSHAILTNVTFSGNQAANGGAIFNFSDISLQLTNVTMYQNTADSAGGAIFSWQNGSITTMTNSIVWGNQPTDSQIHNDSGSNTNITYSDIQGGYTGTGNMDSDPLLGSLADNGGFTKTHALMMGSPVIDTLEPATCPVTDQRGVTRPIDGNGDGEARCDMGAYEANEIMLLYLPLLVK